MPRHIWLYLLPRLSSHPSCFLHLQALALSNSTWQTPTHPFETWLRQLPPQCSQHSQGSVPPSLFPWQPSCTRLWQEGLNKSEWPACHMSVMASGGPFTREGAPFLYICVSSKCTLHRMGSLEMFVQEIRTCLFMKNVTPANSLPHNLQVWLFLVIFHKEEKHLESLGFIKSCQMHISNVNYTQAGIIMQK